MKNIFSRFLRGDEKVANKSTEPEASESITSSFLLKSTPEEANAHADGMREALQHVISKSPYIKKDMQSEALSYLTSDKKELANSETPLTSDEKRTLGFNPRAKITREGLAILTGKAIEQGITPTQLRTSIHISANRWHHLKSSVERMRQLGAKRYSVMIGNTGLECDWCKSMNSKVLDISQDLYSMAEENCANELQCVLTTNIVVDW